MPDILVVVYVVAAILSNTAPPVNVKRVLFMFVSMPELKAAVPARVSDEDVRVVRFGALSVEPVGMEIVEDVMLVSAGKLNVPPSGIDIVVPERDCRVGIGFVEPSKSK